MKDSKDILDAVMSEYTRISEAPKAEPGHLVNDPKKLEAWIRRERQRRYKAIDGLGNVFLVVNPLVWPVYDDEDGKVHSKRPKPELVMKAPEARALAGKTARAAKKEQGEFL